MKLVVLFVAVLAACKDKKQPSTETYPPVVNCTAVGDAVAKTWLEKGKRAKSDPERDAAAKLGPIAGKRLVDRCGDDRWTADAVTCVIAVLEKKRAEELEAMDAGAEYKPAGPDPLQKCLTEDQFAKLIGLPPQKDAPRFREKK
jgi:hypothetical protein